MEPAAAQILAAVADTRTGCRAPKEQASPPISQVPYRDALATLESVPRSRGAADGENPGHRVKLSGTMTEGESET